MQGTPTDMSQQTISLGSDTWILLGLSALVLAGGLIFAILYKRRRW
jgi:hypothetical protein